jgi:hypothetical protein
VRKNAVESDLSAFVGIEALVEKVAQEAPVLRNAFAVNACDGRDGVGCMLGVRRKIAHRRETSAGNDRVGDRVHVFVNLAGLEAPA